MYGSKLTSAEAAKYLGKSTAWIYGKMKTTGQHNDPEFHAICKPFKVGRTTFFWKSNLDAYLNRDSKRSPTEIRATSLAARLGMERADQAVDYALLFLEAHMDIIEREGWMNDMSCPERLQALDEMMLGPDRPAKKRKDVSSQEIKDVLAESDG